MRILMRGTAVAMAAALLVGCAARRPRTATPPVAPPEVPRLVPGDSGSLSEVIRKVRHLSASARPSSNTSALPTLESRDAMFAADLLLVSTAPTAEAHRRLAERYRERGVLDLAYRHFNRAIALDSRDAAAYEGLARIWRDWHFPELALGDAHRAIFYAPRSGSARNTYGTVMQALGRYQEAQRAYELASTLDPDAAYAINNLCYLSFVRGELDAAVATCVRALNHDPTLLAARNNLALAFAAAGRLDLAREHFLDSADRASALYNTGLVHLAAGDDDGALSAFDAASRARPTFTLARERARQIRARLRLPFLNERSHGAGR